jgi:hypothetical protein
MSKNIYQSTQVYKGDKVYNLEKLSWIFNCPVCEYVNTALNKEGAEALEHVHFITSVSIHLDALSESNWDASPLSKVTDDKTIS